MVPIPKTAHGADRFGQGTTPGPRERLAVRREPSNIATARIVDARRVAARRLSADDPATAVVGRGHLLGVLSVGEPTTGGSGALGLIPETEAFHQQPSCQKLHVVSVADG